MDETQNQDAGGVQRTTLGRPWLLKTGAFMLFLVVFGVLGIVDAYWLYPRRGLADASYRLREWMADADRAGKLTPTTFAIPDLKVALKELEAREKDLKSIEQADSAAGRAAKADTSKLEYLRSLERTWRLTPDEKPLADMDKPQPKILVYNPTTGVGTSIASGTRTDLSPRALLDELTQFWNKSKQPTPLSGFDLPFQYVFMVGGLGGGLYLLFVMMRTAQTARKFSWNPAEKRLTIPSGASLTPGDLVEVDKRLWHKFFVTLATKDGSKHTLDVYKYVPLEAWVLDLERTAFPEQAALEEARAMEKAEREAALNAQATDSQQDAGT